LQGDSVLVSGVVVPATGYVGIGAKWTIFVTAESRETGLLFFPSMGEAKGRTDGTRLEGKDGARKRKQEPTGEGAAIGGSK